jgi:protein tyrosine/serine phosphatase
VTSPLRVARALLLVVAALTGAAACSGGRTLPREPALAASEERGLPNLGRVDEGLWRSGQPTREGFLEAKRLGVRTVVNLRSAHSDERRLRGTGLRYVEIPCSAFDIGPDEVARFLKAATDPALRPVLVHCAQGQDRTGACVAAYRVVVQGWERERALEEMVGYGSLALFPRCRQCPMRVDPERMRARVEELPRADARVP